MTGANMPRCLQRGALFDLDCFIITLVFVKFIMVVDNLHTKLK